MADLALLESQKLMSRKNWVIEKLWNYQILPYSQWTIEFIWPKAKKLATLYLCPPIFLAISSKLCDKPQNQLNMPRCCNQFVENPQIFWPKTKPQLDKHRWNLEDKTSKWGIFLWSHQVWLRFLWHPHHQYSKVQLVP